jgi:hypothetical protein
MEFYDIAISYVLGVLWTLLILPRRLSNPILEVLLPNVAAVIGMRLRESWLR